MKPDKIALIYRSPKQNRYSIETLFSRFDALPAFEKIVLPVELDSLSHLFRLIAFSFTIRQEKIHITGDVNYMALFLFWKKIVITVHDLNHYEDLKGLRKKIYGLLWFSLPLKCANRIAVISPYTKQQLQDYFSIRENKISIIPNSFILSAVPETPEKRSSNHFRILCIGNKENKNIRRLLNAVAGMEQIELRLVGAQPAHMMDALRESAIPFSVVSDLSRDELAAEYRNCDMLYFASTKEGFGLPILEAQSAGNPVLTSTTTAMPFVAGDGALLADPYSEEAIRVAVKSIRENGQGIQEMIKRGYANTMRFSQEAFLSAYQELYRSL